MAFDRNPKFGADRSFSESARRVTDLLWDNTGGNLDQFPKSYLETLRHDFSDGRISMLEIIDRVDLGPEATYEDYCEVVDSLMAVNPSQWPDPDSVVEVTQGSLPYEFDYSEELDFSEFDFADEMIEEESVTVDVADDAQLSEKMELFFKKVISSVYLDGVTEVTDTEGNPPNARNNYLMSPDGKSFSGIFYDSVPNEQAKQYPFSITEGANGKWSIKY